MTHGIAHSPPPSPETLAALRELYPEEWVRRWSPPDAERLPASLHAALEHLHTPRTRRELGALLRSGGVAGATGKLGRLLKLGLVEPRGLVDGLTTYAATPAGLAALAVPPRKAGHGGPPGPRLTPLRRGILRAIAEHPDWVTTDLAADRCVTYQCARAHVEALVALGMLEPLTKGRRSVLRLTEGGREAVREGR